MFFAAVPFVPGRFEYFGVASVFVCSYKFLFPFQSIPSHIWRCCCWCLRILHSVVCTRIQLFSDLHPVISPSFRTYEVDTPFSFGAPIRFGRVPKLEMRAMYILNISKKWWRLERKRSNVGRTSRMCCVHCKNRNYSHPQNCLRFSQSQCFWCKPNNNETRESGWKMERIFVINNSSTK